MTETCNGSPPQDDAVPLDSAQPIETIDVKSVLPSIDAALPPIGEDLLQWLRAELSSPEMRAITARFPDPDDLLMGLADSSDGAALRILGRSRF